MEDIAHVYEAGPEEDEIEAIENGTTDAIIHETNENLSIFDMFRVDLCARAILDYVPIRELVRSERVCRRWQGVVHKYLRRCRNIHFSDMHFKVEYPPWLNYLKICHTSSYPLGVDRNISLKDYALPFACKTIEKWGCSFVKVITDRDDEDYYEIIASQCTKLGHIEITLTRKYNFQLFYLFKYFSEIEIISLRYSYANEFVGTQSGTEVMHSEVFQKINCNKIELSHCSYVNGGFLKSMKSKNFKALRLVACSLNVSELLSSIHTLRNITSLALEYINFKSFNDIHLLLQELPLLEELSLRNYSSHYYTFSVEFIKSVSQLVNLKRLDMKGNTGVNDEFLEALARGCKKLEYLDIRRREPYPSNFDGYTFRGVGKITARGVAVLCRRSPSAVTTLNLGYIEGEKYNDDWAVVFENANLQEFISYCCLELTPQLVIDKWRASQGRRVQVECQSGCTTAQSKDHQQGLKIMLYHYFSKSWL